jgi:hypothetical protein
MHQIYTTQSPKTLLVGTCVSSSPRLLPPSTTATETKHERVVSRESRASSGFQVPRVIHSRFCRQCSTRSNMIRSLDATHPPAPNPNCSLQPLSNLWIANQGEKRSDLQPAYEYGSFSAYFSDQRFSWLFTFLVHRSIHH